MATDGKNHHRQWGALNSRLRGAFHGRRHASDSLREPTRLVEGQVLLTEATPTPLEVSPKP